MTLAYSIAVPRLRTRVRQTGDVALTEDQAIELLSHCQRHVNAAMHKHTTTTNFSTLAEKQLYTFPDDLSSAIDIVSMTESDRELFHCQNLSEFAAYENNWFRNITGARFEAWCQISRDYFIIYPAKAAGSSVTIKYVVATPIYDDYAAHSADEILLPDEDIETVVKLAELLALVRSRQTGLIKKTLEQTIKYLEARNVAIKSANP